MSNHRLRTTSHAPPRGCCGVVGPLLLLAFCISRQLPSATAQPAGEGAPATRLSENPGGVLYPTHVNDKGGYIDQTGRVVIPHRFGLVFPFGDDGFAVTWEDEGSLAINRRGDVVLRGEEVHALGRGRFAVQEGGRVRFVGLLEPFATTVRCTSVVGPFSEGYIAVKVDGKWGFMNELGQLAIPPMCDEAVPFREGLALARQGAKWGYIDQAGRWAIPPQFDGGVPFREGLAVVMLNERRHHIDKSGQRAFKAAFADVGVFSEGLASAQDPHTLLYGYIDRMGNWRIAPRFRLAHVFSEGLAAAWLPDQRAVYIDHTGDVAIQLPENCRHHKAFWQGRADVWIGNREGWIDRRGAWVWFTEEP